MRFPWIVAIAICTWFDLHSFETAADHRFLNWHDDCIGFVDSRAF
jgi:hypothetical protein